MGTNRLKRAEGKAFNARIPDELHNVLKRLATERANKFGGQVNINREIVSAIFVALTPHLSESDAAKIAAFIQQL